MQNFIKTVTEWMLNKEEDMAKECAVPMEEIEYQIAKVESQKEKIQAKYDEALNDLDTILDKLHKIKNIEMLRCQN